MKITPLFGIRKEPISFNIGTLDFISLEDVKKFLFLNKNFTFENVKILHYYMGNPIFVNVDESIKQNKIIFYSDEEIQWYCDKDCNSCDIANI